MSDPDLRTIARAWMAWRGPLALTEELPDAAYAAGCFAAGYTLGASHATQETAGNRMLDLERLLSEIHRGLCAAVPVSFVRRDEASLPLKTLNEWKTKIIVLLGIKERAG